MIGLGCAPIYPCLIHSTPDHFGADKSQAIIGIQMACAYVGSSLMPPLFGLIAGHITVSLLPVYLSAILVLMIVMHEGLIRKTAQKEAARPPIMQKQSASPNRLQAAFYKSSVGLPPVSRWMRP